MLALIPLHNIKNAVMNERIASKKEKLLSGQRSEPGQNAVFCFFAAAHWYFHAAFSALLFCTFIFRIVESAFLRLCIRFPAVPVII